MEQGLTILELAEALDLSPASLKGALAIAGVRKGRSQASARTWRDSTPEAKTSRIAKAREARAATYANSQELQASLRASALRGSARNAELRREAYRKLSERIRRELAEGKRLAFHSRGQEAKGKLIYREYRESLSNAHLCDICGRPENSGKSLAVDHNHETGAIRGLLCFGCNTFLGWVERYLSSLDSYLTRQLSSVKYHKGLLDDPSSPYERGDKSYCELCNREGAFGIYDLVIDHCHSSGKIRGVLCNSCNVRVGRIENTPRFKNYLESESLGELIKW